VVAMHSAAFRPKGHTGPAEEMFEAVNAGWMDLGVEGTEHVAGMMSARDLFAAAQTAELEV
jgi:hypothetical protein